MRLPDDLREGSKSAEAFEEGATAYKAGKPISAATGGHTWEWKRGWQVAENEKKEAYYEYRKTRSLMEDRWAPPGFSRKDADRLQLIRKAKLREIEAVFPDFKAAYEKTQHEKEYQG